MNLEVRDADGKYAPAKWYYKEELEYWEENGDDKPQPIEGKPDNIVLDGWELYCGIGFRF